MVVTDGARKMGWGQTVKSFQYWVKGYGLLFVSSGEPSEASDQKWHILIYKLGLSK